VNTPFVVAISPVQLISELDITGGDERKVGYYAGLVVGITLFGLDYYLLILQFSGITFLCNGSNHGPSLESNVGLCRPKANLIDWSVWIVRVDALFWALSYLFGLDPEVGLFACAEYSALH
jgi:hypothetical protein